MKPTVDQLQYVRYTVIHMQAAELHHNYFLYNYISKQLAKIDVMARYDAQYDYNENQDRN